MYHNNWIDKNSCQSKLENELVQNSALKFYKIRGARRDLKWISDNPLTLFAPFLTPETKTIQTWLSDNIEDECKWKDWKLKIDFTENNFGTTHITFTPSATPHVNGLGGNEITMDANRTI